MASETSGIFTERRPLPCKGQRVGSKADRDLQAQKEVRLENKENSPETK